MEEDIRITIDKYFNNTIINEIAANEILQAYINYHDIRKYAKKIVFSNERYLENGLYDHINNEIIILPKNIKKRLLLLYFTKIINNQNIKFYNIIMLKTIFHEISHAEQRKIINEGNGFEKDILIDSNNLFNNNPRKYNRHYQYMVEEYNAFFKAYLALHEYCLDECEQLTDNFNTFFYYYYGKYNCSPYEKFQKISKIKREIPEVSLYDKAQYGLPMRKEEKTKVLTLVNTTPGDLINY